MKITSLLTQYLETHHRLDLPGIGSFILDPSAASQAVSRSSGPIGDAVQFEYRTDLKEPTELIRFISEQTGKMKALASSDLDSYIELAQQFLNIGKPFTLDGIGTLVKVKPGEYEFSSLWGPANDKRRDAAMRETAKAVVKEDAGKYESFLNEPKREEGIRKPVIAMLIISGLALAIWGGYTISKKNNDSQEPAANSYAASVEDADKSAVAANDTVTSTIAETIAETKPTVNSGEYKYVLENTNRNRAFRRYNQLLTNLWKVNLETVDSVQFKLYMTLPKDYGDTTRIKDSLKIMLGRPVYIEH